MIASKQARMTHSPQTSPLPPPPPVNQHQLSNPFPKWWFPSNCWGTHQYNPPVLWSSRSSPVYRLIQKPADDCHWRKHSLSRTGCDLPQHTVPDHSTAMRSKVMLISFIFILVIKFALKQIIRDCFIFFPHWVRWHTLVHPKYICNTTVTWVSQTMLNSCTTWH